MPRLMEDLQILGGDPYEIADLLFEQGVWGQRGEPEHCPVANYLKNLGYEHISVMEDDDQRLVVSTANEEFPAPAALARFIREFDSGSFDELLPPVLLEGV